MSAIAPQCPEVPIARGGRLAHSPGMHTPRFVIPLLLTTLTAPAPAWLESAQAQAPGAPIFDCAGMQATAARLRAGLPVQDEWIARTEAQLREAEAGVRQSKAELQQIALKSARDLAAHQLAQARVMRDMIEQQQGWSSLTRRRWLARVDEIQKLGEEVEKATSAGTAGLEGFTLGTAIARNRAKLSDFANFLQDSGISDEAAKVAAGAVMGPAGALLVESFAVTRDIFYAGLSGALSADEADVARQNLASMKAARQLADTKIFELEREPACAPRTPVPEDRIAVQPEPAAPATPPSTTPSAPATPAQAPAGSMVKKRGHGGAATLAVLAAGGAAGLYAYNKYKTSETCTPTTSNIIAICSSQGGGSSQCKSAIAEATSYCQCLGYSTFDTGSGACR